MSTLHTTHIYRAGPVQNCCCASVRGARRTITLSQHSAVTSSGRGFGAKGGSKGVPKVGVAPVEHVKANQLLKKLVKAKDLQAVATQHTDDLTQTFFAIVDACIGVAEREGNATMVENMKRILKAAMTAKTDSLRPEIRLLNYLLRSQSAEERREMLSTEENRDALVMNDGYFFNLLDKVVSDLQQDPDSPNKQDVLSKMDQIKKECRQLCVASAA